MMVPRWLVRVSWAPLLISFATGGVAAILVYLTDVVDARQIEVQAHDATLSRDPVSDVAITTAMFLPGALALAVLTFVVSEFGLKRWTGASRSQKVANVLQACAHLVAAFAYQVSIQQMSAVLTGSPRPSYLSKCEHGQPLFDEEGGTDILPTDCTGSKIKDELKTFPSGHASSAALVLLFGLFYLNHAAHRRVTRPLLAPATWQAALLSDLGWGCLLCYNWLIFAAVWTIGATRYTDNKHKVADIVAGWFLGTFFAVITLWNCVVLQQRIAARYDADGGELASKSTSLESKLTSSSGHADVRTGSKAPPVDVVVLPASKAAGDASRDIYTASVL